MAIHHTFARCVAGVMTCLLTGTGIAQDTIVVPTDYPTIQQAIDAASDNDSIFVLKGTYAEAIDLGHKDISIHGQGPAYTIIDASVLSASAVTAAPATLATIADLAITGGTGTVISFLAQTDVLAGGGVFVQSGTLYIENCRVTENTAQLGGGVFVNAGAASSMTSCLIDSNMAMTGGGVFSNGGLPTVKNCIIEGNSATNGGGGFFVGDVTITDSDFLFNVVDGDGGGVLLAGGAGTIVGSRFHNNDAKSDGGGVRVTEHAVADISHAQFTRNAGAAVSVGTLSDTTIDGSSFCENTPVDFSGIWSDAGGNSFADVCANLCNDQCEHAALSGCWCDNHCVIYDDCCVDVCEVCQHIACNPTLQVSCAYSCGATPPQGCWCDNMCLVFGDCCPDVCQWCDYAACDGARDSCKGLCGFDAPSGCRCDSDCVQEGNCCNDACSECGHCHAADLNGDGVVDVIDLLILLAAWGKCPNGQACPADLNNDGIVDVSDLLILLANWT